MSDDQAFQRAIAADTTDSTSRLVYADWLAERDDPRGEFIRLQHETEQSAPHTARYAALRNRLKLLRSQIDAAWVAAMSYQPTRWPKIETNGETGEWAVPGTSSK